MIFDRDLHHSGAQFTLIGMKCEICNREFEAVSPAARYCGTNCRSTAYRARLQLAARAGLREQPARGTGETVQRAEGDDEGLPPRSVGAGADEEQSPRSQEATTIDRREPRASWSAAAAPAKATALRPSDEPSAAVRALADTLVKRRLGPLQRSIEELQRKTAAQTATYEAALTKERKKNKKLRKKLARPSWAGGGSIASWLMPVLAAGGGGLLVNLLTKTDGKKIGTWLADVLSSTPQAPSAGDDAMADLPTLAELIQEKFSGRTQSSKRAGKSSTSNPAKHGGSSGKEAGPPPAAESVGAAGAGRPVSPQANGGTSASSSQDSVSAPSPADPDLPEMCVPWVLTRDDASDLLSELTGAQRRDGEFVRAKFDWRRPLAARLIASVEPSLVWQRKRGPVWFRAWELYQGAMGLLQFVQRIEHAANAQLPFKDLPITPTALALMDAARELQERLRSHLCRIQNQEQITFETPIELVHAATRVEWAVKRARPPADDRLASALHDALVDLHSLVLATHGDELDQLSTHPRGAPVENSTIVENRHDLEVRSDEIEALRPTAWALERYGPPPAPKPFPPPPPQPPDGAADSIGPLDGDSRLKPSESGTADVTSRTPDAREKPSTSNGDDPPSVDDGVPDAVPSDLTDEQCAEGEEASVDHLAVDAWDEDEQEVDERSDAF